MRPRGLLPRGLEAGRKLAAGKLGIELPIGDGADSGGFTLNDGFPKRLAIEIPPVGGCDAELADAVGVD